MGISDRLSELGRRLTGAKDPTEEERLLQLFWNRAELKKELLRLQTDCHGLTERWKKQEAALLRLSEQHDQLEQYLGDPDNASHGLVYFQLRRLWRVCTAQLLNFTQQLQRQQEERERRRQLIEFDQDRRRRLADFDAQLHDAHREADDLGAVVKATGSKLERSRGFWNYFKRRRLSEQLLAEQAQLDEALTRVTDLSDERAAVEGEDAPAFPGMSVDGRRIVNTAAIAYAQQLVLTLSKGGLAPLAKETMAKRVYEVRYGSRDDCTRLMAALRDGFATVSGAFEDLTVLKERTDTVRSTASYRSDADTVPLTDSIGALPAPAMLVSGLETANRSGINVLVDDYWDVYQCLIQ